VDRAWYNAADDTAPNSDSLKGYDGKMAATKENSFKNIVRFNPNSIIFFVYI
jgi:hypothetical protein